MKKVLFFAVAAAFAFASCCGAKKADKACEGEGLVEEVVFVEPINEDEVGAEDFADASEVEEEVEA